MVQPQQLYYQPPVNTTIPVGFGQPFYYPIKQAVGGATQVYSITEHQSAMKDASFQQLKLLPGKVTCKN